ncbi:hypothetical protein [Kribbella sp. C-35]|uniref:hypothetical protein n=1 Tax=Kribbella sp. C-35 TaxID=2789276 RepID=UPI003979465E
MAAHGGLGRRVAATEAASHLALRCLALLRERLALLVLLLALVLLTRVLALRRVLLAAVLWEGLARLLLVLLTAVLLARVLLLTGLTRLLGLAVLRELLLLWGTAGRLT